MDKTLEEKLKIFTPRKNRPDTKILAMVEQTHTSPKQSEYLTAYEKEGNDITIIYDKADTLTERQKEYLMNCYHDRLEDGLINHYRKGVEK